MILDFLDYLMIAVSSQLFKADFLFDQLGFWETFR